MNKTEFLLHQLFKICLYVK